MSFAFEPVLQPDVLVRWGGARFTEHRSSLLLGWCGAHSPCERCGYFKPERQRLCLLEQWVQVWWSAFFSTLCLLFSDLFLTFAYVEEDNMYTYSLAFEILVILMHLDLIEKELFRRAPFPSSAAAVMRSLWSGLWLAGQDQRSVTFIENITGKFGSTYGQTRQKANTVCHCTEWHEVIW